MSTHRFSGSQLKGSALTSSLLMTELVESDPVIPALRPEHIHSR